MFSLYAKKNVIKVNETEIVTSGSVNVYQVKFQFNEAWNGLLRTAVFRASDRTVSILLDDTGLCTIPWEVLQDAKRTLYAGVYGTKDGNVVLPTIWASLGEIKRGVDTGMDAQPPTPGLYEQLLAEIGDLSELQTVSKDSLVGAINELYVSGGGGGSGNVSSPDINMIRVIDLADYEKLASKDSHTLYLIRG